MSGAAWPASAVRRVSEVTCGSGFEGSGTTPVDDRVSERSSSASVRDARSSQAGTAPRVSSCTWLPLSTAVSVRRSQDSMVSRRRVGSHASTDSDQDGPLDWPRESESARAAASASMSAGESR